MAPPAPRARNADADAGADAGAIADGAGGKGKIGILAVCLGNICRSPTAEAVLRAAVERRGLGARFDVDSCGTGGGASDVSLFVFRRSPRTRKAKSEKGRPPPRPASYLSFSPLAHKSPPVPSPPLFTPNNNLTVVQGGRRLLPRGRRRR